MCIRDSPDDEVGLDRVLDGQPSTHRDPRLVDHAIPDDRIRPGQIDVFEDAALGFGFGEMVRPQPVLVDDEQLTGLDLADDGGADGLQGRSLRGDHPTTVEAAEREGADAVPVAGGIQGVFCLLYTSRCV